MNRYKIDKVWGHTHPKIELHPEGVWVLYVDAQSQAAEIEQLKAENKQLRAVADAAARVRPTEHRGGWQDYVPGLMELEKALAALKETTK